MRSQQEIQDIAAHIDLNGSDSPEIGPPPVSKFVDEDPVKIDLPSRERKERKEGGKEHGGLDPSLSINLEQRRKRKDSIGSTDPGRASKSESTTFAKEASVSLKSGAKRKLGVREDDEGRIHAPEIDKSPDDFKYTRVTNDEKTKNKLEHGSKNRRDSAVIRGNDQESHQSSAAPTHRKVLAAKSVNNSPSKAPKTPALEEGKPIKPDARQPNPVKEWRERRQIPVINPPPSAPLIDTIVVQTEPETPAGADLFSPLSSVQSSNRADSRDTPPPPELGPGMEGQRPSRRARGAVSYAEPNLRDKMRRPTKDFVDAVARGEKEPVAGSVKLEGGSAQPDMIIKPETELDDAWKSMPVASVSTVEHSPLRSKLSTADSLPSTITTHRKRRESLLQHVEAESQRQGSGSAIAALLAETRKVKAVAKEKERERITEEESRVSNAMSKLDIHESKDVPQTSDRAGSGTVKEERVPSRNSKRTSSAPRDISRAEEGEASDMESSRKTDGPARRRQSTLGHRSSSIDTSSKEISDKLLKRPASAANMSELPASGARTDRVSARRRSMML